MIGELIEGRYVIESYLGGGAMGDVWLALDLTLGRQVALKRIQAQRGTRAELTARAFREAEALARIDHPGIVKIYDVLRLDEGPCIVMAYVQGTRLSDLIKRTPPSEATVTRFGSQVLDALNAAHAVGVLHRDVKPENILITDGGRVVLVDFGIAAIDGHPRLTAVGEVIGTVEYIAPERLRGKVAEAAADLWSLGATLYMALEGRTPFERASVEATIAAILGQPPHPMIRSVALRPLIGRLLEKDPARRISGGELKRTLGRTSHRPPPPDPTPPPPPQQQQQSRAAFGAIRRARKSLAGTDPREAAAALAVLPPADAAALLTQARTDQASPAVEELCAYAEATAKILQAMPPLRAGRLLNQVGRLELVANVVLNMDARQAGRVLAHLNDRRAAAVIERMAAAKPDLTGLVIARMPPEKAGQALRHLPAEPAVGLLMRCPGDWRDQVLPFVTDAIREQVRRRQAGEG
ncbi:serine/threonine-protein kinase [Acrocarpospora catenulata]|uniref:serine/threonine-protein kinase n=1 Tax=Acrocarpospora catenulata TaxID=2836182 RepID=UPI001BDB481A|nr:serine/threonine-protein kinase [Acrocarpospora catenulata]